MSTPEPRQLATIREDTIRFSISMYHAQYFPGVVAGSSDHAFTGVGDTISETVADLIEMVAQADLGIDDPEYDAISAHFTRDRSNDELTASCHGDCLEQYKREIAEADLDSDILDESFNSWHEQCEMHVYASVRFDLKALPIWQVYDHDRASWTISWEDLKGLCDGNIVFNGWGANTFRQRILNELRSKATHTDPAPEVRDLGFSRIVLNVADAGSSWLDAAAEMRGDN